MDRRMFLSTAAAAPAVVPGRAPGRDGAVAPGERVTLGVIGCGNQGACDMMGLLEDKRVRVVAVCDVNRTISDRPPGGVTFYGADGWVRVNRGWIDANPKSLLESRIGPGEIHLYESKNHFDKFHRLCALSETADRADRDRAQIAHDRSSGEHLAPPRARFAVDPKTERFREDEEANSMLKRPMRHPWTV